MSKSQMKIMLITFFHIKGIVLFEFIIQGQTVNQAYYVEILKWLCEVVHRKSHELWPNSWIPFHDIAPAHRALVRQFLAHKSITEMEYPPCSPDLALNDFWVFLKIKSASKG
jgi:hypothetical protein